MLQTQPDINAADDKNNNNDYDEDNDEDERMLEDMMDVEFDGILQVEQPQPTANGPSSSSSSPPPQQSSSVTSSSLVSPPVAKAPMFQLQPPTNTTSASDSNSEPVLEWDDVAAIRCFELALSSHDARHDQKPTEMDENNDADHDDWVFRPLPLPQSISPSTAIAGHDDTHARDDDDENGGSKRNGDKNEGGESNKQKEGGKWTPSELPMPKWVVDPVYDFRRLASKSNMSCEPNSLS